MWTCWLSSRIAATARASGVPGAVLGVAPAGAAMAGLAAVLASAAGFCGCAQAERLIAPSKATVRRFIDSFPRRRPGWTTAGQAKFGDFGIDGPAGGSAHSAAWVGPARQSQHAWLL